MDDERMLEQFETLNKTMSAILKELKDLNKYGLPVQLNTGDDEL